VTCNVENVALTGTYSAPSMAETGSSVNISAVGTSDSLCFYWAEKAKGHDPVHKIQNFSKGSQAASPVRQ
jgi:hypothetical protein